MIRLWIACTLECGQITTLDVQWMITSVVIQVDILSLSIIRILVMVINRSLNVLLEQQHFGSYLQSRVLPTYPTRCSVLPMQRMWRALLHKYFTIYSKDYGLMEHLFP